MRSTNFTASGISPLLSDTLTPPYAMNAVDLGPEYCANAARCLQEGQRILWSSTGPEATVADIIAWLRTSFGQSTRLEDAIQACVRRDLARQRNQNKDAN